MTTSSQPAALGQYLAWHGFAPDPGNTERFDRGTGRQVICVLNEPGETTWLYRLDPRSGYLYEVRLSPGIPDAVIKAAARLPSPWAGQAAHEPAARAPGKQ